MVVMPSHYSFGIVALEAMAMGTPVIVGSGQLGLSGTARRHRFPCAVALIPEALAAAMLELLTDDALRQQLGEDLT